MHINVDGIGILKKYFDNMIVEVKEPSTVQDVLLALENILNLSFLEGFLDDVDSSSIIILLNGVNIYQYKGFITLLRNDDRLIFLIMVNGG